MKDKKKPVKAQDPVKKAISEYERKCKVGKKKGGKK
jgi:hypothetical protein